MENAISSALGVDWMMASLPVDPPYPDRARELYCVVSEDGADRIEWRRPAWTEYKRDSGSSLMRIKLDYSSTSESGRVLVVDGNIGRWGRSHNYLLFSFRDSYDRFYRDLSSLYRVRYGEGEVLRIDLAFHLAFSSQADAYLWMRWAGTQKLARKSPSVYDNGVAWKAARWYMKVYDKIADLRRRGHSHVCEKLDSYILRCEITLRHEILKGLGCNALRVWLDDRVYTEVANLILNRFEVSRLLNSGAGVSVEELTEMPYRLYTAAEAWRHGYDYRRAMLEGRISRSTYYRLRKELLPYGYDISQQCNVISMPVRTREVRYSILQRQVA